MKTLQDLKFTKKQEEWVLHYVSNFKGILDEENAARKESAKLAKSEGLSDFRILVYHVWNGLSGADCRYGYTVGWKEGAEVKSLFKNGIEPPYYEKEWDI